jgi:transcriptional regulator with XRE-family HTH domain
MLPPMTSEQIAQLRKDLGLSQVDFAQLLGVHFMTVSKWERGESVPTSYQLVFMDQFRRTADARKAESQEQVKKLLLGAGVIAALMFLLSAKG